MLKVAIFQFVRRLKRTTRKRERTDPFFRTLKIAFILAIRSVKFEIVLFSCNFVTRIALIKKNPR